MRISASRRCLPLPGLIFVVAVPPGPRSLLVATQRRQLSSKAGVVVKQRRKLQQTGVQPLQPAFRHRVESPKTLLSARALQPTKENLSSTGIRDCALL